MASQPHLVVGGRYREGARLDADFNVDRNLANALGTGVSGTVYRCKHKASGREYAVKTFSKRGLWRKQLQALRSEVELSLQMDHPHIVRLEYVYDEPDTLHLIMELMEGGELFDRVVAAGKPNETAAARTTRQMLLAVSYLHSEPYCVVHRDLKLENFLYLSAGSDHLKLIDFGLSKHWNGTKKGMLTERVGTFGYAAPEVIGGRYDAKCDVWSIGVIVYAMLTGQPPFPQDSESSSLMLLKSQIPWVSSCFKALSASAQSFLQGLIRVQPAERPSAVDCLNDPWITQRYHNSQPCIDLRTLQSLRHYTMASSFRRACLSLISWSLSAEDRAGVFTQFEELDRDNNGKLSLKEFQDVLQQTHAVNSTEAEAIFACMDVGGTGSVAYSEFLAAAMHGRLNDEVLRSTFRRFDDNVLTAEGMHRVLGYHVDLEADTDGDGQVSYAEFADYMLRMDGLATPKVISSQKEVLPEASSFQLDMEEDMLSTMSFPRSPQTVDVT